MVLLVKRGENERWEEKQNKNKKKKRKKKKGRKKRHACKMTAPSDNGFAANVNDPTAAGGMAATDVTQTSGQAKTREFLTTHWFNNPEDGCHIYIYVYVYMCIFICIYMYVYMYVSYMHDYMCVYVYVCT